MTVARWAHHGFFALVWGSQGPSGSLLAELVDIHVIFALLLLQGLPALPRVNLGQHEPVDLFERPFVVELELDIVEQVF